MNCVSLRSRTSAVYFERRFLCSAFGLVQQRYMNCVSLRSRMSHIVLGWFNSGYTVIVMRRRPLALWLSRQARAFAYLESASRIHVYEESVSLESSIFGVGATRLADHLAQNLRAQVFPPTYGSALVGEFMVAFLLVFTVLRTAVNSDFVYSLRRLLYRQQADCYGSALVGEFMVDFLLVFTVLQTESRVKVFGFHEEF